jgi:hypothetical protein
VPATVSRFAVGSSAEDHGRRAGQGARDGDALLLAAGEVAGQEVEAVAEADPGQRGRRLLVRAAALPALDVQRVFDVLERGQGGEEVVLLEHEADGPPAHVAELVGPRGVHALARDRDLAGSRREDAAHDGEERGLARARTGPSRATTSPGATVMETPRRTSTRCEPSSNTFTTALASGRSLIFH